MSQASSGTSLQDMLYRNSLEVSFKAKVAVSNTIFLCIPIVFVKNCVFPFLNFYWLSFVFLNILTSLFQVCLRSYVTELSDNTIIVPQQEHFSYLCDVSYSSIWTARSDLS